MYLCLINEVVKLLFSIYRNQVFLLIILDEFDNGVGKLDYMGFCVQVVMKVVENFIKIGKERVNNLLDQVVLFVFFLFSIMLFFV